MINDNEVLAHSCPTCEYRYGHTGQAVSYANGLLRCNICNSKWRVLNNIQNANNESDGHLQKFKAQATLANIPGNNEPGQGNPDYHGKKRSGFSALSAGIFCTLIILAIGGGYQVLVFGDYTRQNKIQTAALTLDNIKVEDHSNNQLPFWVITARISNNTGHSVAVPPILMRSGNKGSSGYFGWAYTPALQKLKPGTNLIIRTSIHKPVGSSKNIKMKFADNNLNSG